MVLVLYTVFFVNPGIEAKTIEENSSESSVQAISTVEFNKHSEEKQSESRQPKEKTIYYQLIANSYQTRKPVETYKKEFLVPWQNSDFKAYMSYEKITDKTSPQWYYRNNAWTDSNGLRRVDDDYLVAMGTYYSDSVGERFRITLDSGDVFTVRIGDIKNPLHTDIYNMYTPVKDNSGKFYSANVLEFIVDTDKLDTKAAKLGTVSCIAGLGGNIAKVEKLKSRDVIIH
jgi:hypothetical protein